MMLMANDLIHIVKAVMGKTPREMTGKVIVGDVPNEGYHPQIRIDEVRDDCGGGPDDVLLGVDSESGSMPKEGESHCEYLFIRFTHFGAAESPSAPMSWQMWVLTYGPKPEDWNIHIPDMVTASGKPMRYNRMRAEQGQRTLLHATPLMRVRTPDLHIDATQMSSSEIMGLLIRPAIDIASSTDGIGRVRISMRVRLADQLGERRHTEVVTLGSDRASMPRQLRARIDELRVRHSDIIQVDLEAVGPGQYRIDGVVDQGPHSWRVDDDVLRVFIPRDGDVRWLSIDNVEGFISSLREKEVTHVTFKQPKEGFPLPRRYAWVPLDETMTLDEFITMVRRIEAPVSKH